MDKTKPMPFGVIELYLVRLFPLVLHHHSRKTREDRRRDFVNAAELPLRVVDEKERTRHYS